MLAMKAAWLTAVATGNCPGEFALSPPSCDFPASAFDNVYASGEWGVGLQDAKGPAYYYPVESDHENQLQFRRSLSGEGSGKGAATSRSLSFLRRVIKTYNIKTMLDVPCGDANWQFDSWQTDSLQAYVGLDVVRPVLKLNAERFAHHRNKRFAPWDLAACPALPRLNFSGAVVPFDLVHVRDVIQHLSLSQGVAALRKVAASGARIFVSTTYPGKKNRNVGEGKFYHNNLNAPPFSLPKPLHCVATHPSHESDETCAWNIDASFLAALREQH